MFNRIVVAISPLTTENSVLHEAVELAKINNATLMLLHVLSPMDEGYPTPIYPGPDSVYPGLHEEAIKTYARQWESYERSGIELLNKLFDEVTAMGVNAEFSQNVGDPGRVICDLASTWNADLIMLGRRGHTGIRELFLGSVSNYVLHHAPCSVLTIQGEEAVTPD